MPVSVNINPNGMRRSRIIFSLSHSVKENVDSDSAQENADSQSLGALPPGDERARGLGRERVNQPDQFRLGPRFGHETHHDSDDEVRAEGEDRAPEVLRHVAGIVVEDSDPSAVDAGACLDGQREPVMQHRRRGACDQPGKCAVAGGPLPEHAQEEGRKERGIHKREDQLQRVHDVVEVDRRIRGRNREQNAADRGPSSHSHVVPVAGALANVGLVEIVSKYSIESRYVACHAAHEAGQQRSEAEAENARRKEV